MKILLSIPFFLFMLGLSAQKNTLGSFSSSGDVGNPKLAGSSTYNPANQTYTLKGAGYNIWFERDEFQYLYNKIDGDFMLTANFAFVGEGVDPHRKIGWMVRKSMDEKAAHFSTVLHGDGLMVAQWRVLKGAFMRDPEDEIFAPKAAYDIIQLERSGDKFTMRAAHTGEPLQEIGSQEMDNLSGEVLAGLFICSHNGEVVEEAKIWNVRIDQPGEEGFNPYQGADAARLGCRLETLDISNGHRKVVFEKESRFEAPNWMPDGERLLFNMEGSIYTIPLTGGEPEKLNTGTADRNNNDHGISFDGKSLAISHHRDGLAGGGSTVYVLPLEGGTPKIVTDKTPSYWHGWAPNNKEVLYVAQREENGSYNIYKKSIDGGEEVKLTDIGPGEHVDGCEYAPDGQYIYYNGNHTGTMQLWRMKPDGSAREQITFDQYNDWFPHISPDGKWIAFISFPPDIPVNDHPFCKQVMLRLMPTSGGAVKVIGYLYGGQGTINVPSWSPDSKFISFVSNTVKR